MNQSAIVSAALAFVLGLTVLSNVQAQTAGSAGQASTKPALTASGATPPPLSKDALEDIAKHEKIAAAHTEAAKCLRAGKSDEVCEAPLAQACKGIAIGKFCGMKH